MEEFWAKSYLRRRVFSGGKAKGGVEERGKGG